MESKIIIAIGIIAAVALGGYAVYSQMSAPAPDTEILIADDIENSTNMTKVTTDEKTIDEAIEQMQKKTDEFEYKPKPREWQSSGPFEIDRKEYILGEKIFMRINYLDPKEKGQIAVMRPLNDTHYSVYQTVPFDGAKPKTFNVYFEPGLSKTRDICTVEDLVGKWAVVFRGTDYENLYFNVTEQILPGDKERYEPVC